MTMSKRPILRLKLRATAPDVETLLEQGSEIDPHNPHKLVQPSKAVVPDLERLTQILDIFRQHATGTKTLNPRLADALKHEGSSLLVKLGNAASDHAINRE
jgi:hypothetical protein